MICNNCGNEFSDETNVCPECGAEVEPVAEETPEMAVSASDGFSGYDSEEEEDFEVDLYNAKDARTSLILKIAAIAVAVILVITAGIFVFHGVIRPDIDNPITSLFDDVKTVKPIVYTKKINDTNGLYVGETQLATFSNTQSRFELYTHFVYSDEDIYYIVNGELFWHEIGGKAPVKVSDNVDTSSIVMCANGKRILFTTTAGEQTTLYSYIRGKKADAVDILPAPQNAYGLPNYGFIGQSSEFWFVKSEQSGTNGDLYATSLFSGPKLKFSGVESVVYYSSDYDAIIYTVVSEQNVSLYAKLGALEPRSLVTEFNGALEPIVIKAPTEGIAYIGDDGAGNNTLYFLPFKGTERVIDTLVMATISATDSSDSESPYHDYSQFVKKSDALYYLKSDMQILISRGANPGQIPTDFSFTSSEPSLSDDANTIAYLTADDALMVSSFDGSTWSPSVKVADSVASFKISPSGNYLGYSVPAEDNTLSIYLYNMKTNQPQLLSSSAASNILFDINIPDTVIFATDYNVSTNAAILNYYKDGSSIMPITDNAVGLTQSSSGQALIVTNGSKDGLLNVYTLNKKAELIPAATDVSSINAY